MYSKYYIVWNFENWQVYIPKKSQLCKILWKNFRNPLTNLPKNFPNWYEKPSTITPKIHQIWPPESPLKSSKSYQNKSKIPKILPKIWVLFSIRCNTKLLNSLTHKKLLGQICSHVQAVCTKKRWKSFSIPRLLVLHLLLCKCYPLLGLRYPVPYCAVGLRPSLSVTNTWRTVLPPLWTARHQCLTGRPSPPADHDPSAPCGPTLPSIFRLLLFLYLRLPHRIDNRFRDLKLPGVWTYQIYTETLLLVNVVFVNIFSCLVTTFQGGGVTTRKFDRMIPPFFLYLPLRTKSHNEGIRP